MKDGIVVDIRAARARIHAHMEQRFVHLRMHGTSASLVDSFVGFLRAPGTLVSPSLIVRCQVEQGSVEYSVAVDKTKVRWRLLEQFMPFIERVSHRLIGKADFLVLLSDNMYVADAHIERCAWFLQRVPFMRCEWLEGDPVSSHCLLIPDFELQSIQYAQGIEELDETALSVSFIERLDVIKWRGRLTGPGFPDLDNCHKFPRYHLLKLAASAPEILDARLTYRDNFPDTPSGQALLAYLDGLQGGQAAEIPVAEFALYKYVLSLDGVTSTWGRVANLLRTGSALLLQHRWRQFFHPGLIEWEHYLPIADDLSDLFARYDWLRKHPACAERIGHQGRLFATSLLSVCAIEDYFVAVFERCAALRPVAN
jgi:hypothetical protein